MDLNRLYSDHQLMLVRARRAPTCITRNFHEAQASHLARRIGKIQREMGAGAALTWERLSAVSVQQASSVLEQ